MPGFPPKFTNSTVLKFSTQYTMCIRHIICVTQCHGITDNGWGSYYEILLDKNHIVSGAVNWMECGKTTDENRYGQGVLPKFGTQMSCPVALNSKSGTRCRRTGPITRHQTLSQVMPMHEEPEWERSITYQPPNPEAEVIRRKYELNLPLTHISLMGGRYQNLSR